MLRFSSSATRHLLLDVAVVSRQPLVNLQNARVVAIGGAVVASGAFFLVYFALRGDFDFPNDAGVVRRWERRSFRGELIARPPSDREAQRLRNLRYGDLGQADGSGDRTPYSYRIRIEFLAKRPDDTRVAWTVRLAEKESPAERNFCAST